MPALNMLRCSCTFYQNVYSTVMLKVFTKRTCQKILPTSSSVVLNGAFTFNSKYVMGIRGFSTITSKPVGCFKASKTISHLIPSRTLSTVSELKSCWKCGSAIQLVPVFFCPACKVIQAPDEHATHFAIMDCDKSFSLDTQKLQQRYLYLQRSLHPDNFSQKPQKEQEYSEIQSALVNKAYRTLLKPLSRGLYMLELEGMGLEEGTGIGPDSEFLLEIMEINERLAETQVKEDANNIGISIQGRLQDLTEKINSSFQKGDTQSAKMLIIQMKYFANIQEKVKEKLSEMLV
ncbi:hypothetical protein AAFF_G00422770 [Aldrovandia affinis]|uniref:Iron-sulfur cluster co-chaperone protein HscB n=1 Tax=Aldrovandia affinis TaxID=143900 RepID=A0AAD7T7J0_9TELE|nr:hypothetical protein AAFF_G00422770 [Aldrovandia affinis]